MELYIKITSIFALIAAGIYLIMPDKTMYHIDWIFAIATWLVTIGAIMQYIKERRARKKVEKND